jgi:hypothetical protein
MSSRHRPKLLPQATPRAPLLTGPRGQRLALLGRAPDEISFSRTVINRRGKRIIWWRPYAGTIFGINDSQTRILWSRALLRDAGLHLERTPELLMGKQVWLDEEQQRVVLGQQVHMAIGRSPPHWVEGADCDDFGVIAVDLASGPDVTTRAIRHPDGRIEQVGTDAPLADAAEDRHTALGL